MNLIRRKTACFCVAVVLTFVGTCPATTADIGTQEKPKETILLQHARHADVKWKFTTDRPAVDWFKSDFDDSKWSTGSGGFGTYGTPNARIGTEWNTKEIWLRRSFTIDERPRHEVYLELHHDEDATVHLNGRLAAEVNWYNTDFARIPVSLTAAKSLVPGENTIAVHCRQTSGGQYIDVGLVAVEESRWSRAKAWEWFEKQPWPCGFNYIPANAISYTEMWMPYSFDPELIDRELALAESVGFNCLRVVLPFVVWEHDPEAFKRRLDSFVQICDRRGLRVMFALFDDCAFGSEESLKNPKYGKQPDVLKGWYANGWTPSPGHNMVRDKTTWPRLEQYVKDVIGHFKNDRRVWVWDLYNEPTNGGLGNVSVPLTENVFRWARAIGPKQPLTVGQFNGNAVLNRVIFNQSDIITFHDYGVADNLIEHIVTLQNHGRPLINTEWLNRGHGSFVETCLPVFKREKVGCLHWGLINGKTQTDLHWGARPGMKVPKMWQHDIFTGDGEPYQESEIELFKRYLSK